MVLNDTNEPPYTTPDQTGFLDLIASETFRRAGYKLRLVKLPAERGLRNTNDGIEDGELTRIAGLEQIYSNLIRVPEKLLDWEFTAFSKNDVIVPSWTKLREYRVGFIRGWKIYEQGLSGASHITMAENPEQLFRLLALERIDVALYEKWLGSALIQHSGPREAHALTPALAIREMYIYLHKRHAASVPAITAALRSIKSEGFYERIYREKLQSDHETSNR